MKKTYCYLKSKVQVYDVYEYTQSSKFVFYRSYNSESEAKEAIKKLSV